MNPFLSPHAWGWTAYLLSNGCRVEFSPHAWGWTALGSARPSRPYVFPTRVGMDRIAASVTGWRRGVFPTRVGMDRQQHFSGGSDYGFPHTRGMDRPLTAMSAAMKFSPHAWGWTDGSGGHASGPGFSPHAWGWTAGGHHRDARGEVFPTRVGMDLVEATRCTR